MTNSKFIVIMVALCAGCVVLKPSNGQSFPTHDVTITPHVTAASKTPISDLDTPMATLLPIRTATFSPTLTPTAVPSSLTYNPCTASTPADPSSMSIAFAAKWDGDFEIYTVRGDGSHLTQLTSNSMDDVAPVWSPDGNGLAFIAGQSPSSSSQLYLMDSDGANRTLMTPSLSTSALLAWSPNSQQIAFIGVTEQAVDLYVLNIENGSLINLTRGGAYIAMDSLTWSPDGKTIAFAAGLDSTGALRAVLTAKSDGSDLRELVQFTVFTDYLPNWHPVEQLILFVAALGPGLSSEQLYLMNPDGSGRRQLTDTETGKSHAIWSPNGQMIAYGAVNYTFDTQGNYLVLSRMIYVLSRDGTDQRLVVEGKELQSASFSWAPDNRHLAFISTDNETPSLYVTDICDGSASLIAANIALDVASWKP